MKFYCVNLNASVTHNASDYCPPICYKRSDGSDDVCCEGRSPYCTVEHETCVITAPGTEMGQYACRCEKLGLITAAAA